MERPIQFMRLDALWIRELADRACLAVGLKWEWPVLTADHLWAKADVGVKVEVIR
jgi:PIN domain nuclease of toxin-antitoxin system